MTPPGRGGDPEQVTLRSSPRLNLYLATITIVGLGLAAFVLIRNDWQGIYDQILFWPTIYLAAAAILGEVKPIRILSDGAQERTLSTSVPFILALIAVAGVGVAIVAQIIASLLDDILERRSLVKSAFNSAQYALSVLVAGAVYSWLANVPFFDAPSQVDQRHIAPLLAAGIAMIAMNWLLVAVVIAFATGQGLPTVLGDDARSASATHLVLLAVGGIAAAVAPNGVWVLLLLTVPVVAAHVFASAAARHAHEAAHDSLTGLGNRGQLHRDLERAVTSAHLLPAEGPGLVLIDLDHFKDFNDTLGHPVGDTILKEVADRLVEATPENATVHRLGGDEFAVVVQGSVAEAQSLTRDLLASLDAPVRLDNLELLVRASAGVAVAPFHGDNVETLMKNADIALYHAKLERDRMSMYAPEFDINTVERLRLLADLHSALDAEQLHVVYQPQMDLQTGRTVGVEALVRWRHPERGLVRPDEFIHLAENSGLIFPLTAFVLNTAVGDLARWRAKGHRLRMAVNLSARHLSNLALARQIEQALATHGVPAHALVLEVTETGILADPVRVDPVIRALRELGVEIAIDDYGTGNASLSYLKRLSIDELKIDKSFVSNIGADNHDLIIVRSTIALALALDLRVVAEGIEDEPTTEALRGLGKVIGQGFHLGRPVSAREIAQRLAEEKKAAGAADAAAADPTDAAPTDVAPTDAAPAGANVANPTGASSAPRATGADS